MVKRKKKQSFHEKSVEKLEAAMKILGCDIEHDNDGQVVLYTNIFETNQREYVAKPSKDTER